MTRTTENNAGAGRPTSSPNGEKIPDATRQNDHGKGESRQTTGERSDRAPPKHHEKDDVRHGGGAGRTSSRADDDTQKRDADDAARERAMLDRAPAEGKR
jgi:hypothetical protein